MSAIIDDYIEQKDKYIIWYDFIMKARPNINIELSKDSNYYTDENNLLHHLTDNDIDVLDMKKVGRELEIAKISSMTLETITDPFAIYILEVDKNRAQQISSKYNVICHSINEDPKECPIFQEGIEKNIIIGKNEFEGSWGTLIPKDATVPANALIIVDRYLFSSEGNITINDAINNICEMLDKLLPLTLEGDFHVLFIFDISKCTSNRSQCELHRSRSQCELHKSFKDLSTKINKLIKKGPLKRPYTILTETLSISKSSLKSYEYLYRETHNRRILSNYYIIRVEHSFKAFRDGENLYSQSIWLDWASSKGIVVQRKSDMPYKSLYYSIKMIKDIIDKIKNDKSKDGCAGYFFSQNGDVRKEIADISNRLVSGYK